MKKPNAKRLVKVSVPLTPKMYNDLQRRATANGRAKGREVVAILRAAMYGRGK